MKKTISIIVIAAIAAANYAEAAPASKSKHFDRKCVKMVTQENTTKIAKDKEVIKKTVMASGKSSMDRKNRGGSNNIIRRG